MLKTLIATVIGIQFLFLPQVQSGLAPQIPNPTIVYREADKKFDITLTKGAVWGCVFYLSKTETLVQDGKTVPYQFGYCGQPAPTTEKMTVSWESANCYMWDKTDDCPSGGDWEVWTEMQYVKDGTTGNISDDIITTKSNVLTIKH